MWLASGDLSQPQLAHGAHRGRGEPGLSASMASCRDANGSKTKEVPQGSSSSKNAGHCSSSSSAIGSVLEDVAPAARPPTMLRVTSSHNKRSMSLTAAAGEAGRRPSFLSVSLVGEPTFSRPVLIEPCGATSPRFDGGQPTEP